VTPTTVLLIVVRLVAVLIAVSISATSFRAYRRTGRRTFAYTMAGFGTLALGLGIESFLLRAVPMTLAEIHTIESLVFALGFIVLYVSLHGQP